MTAGDPGLRARPRIAFLSYGSGKYDARTFRMARSAIDAGYDVTVYARWYPGLAVTEERDGYRIVRAPFDWRLAVPGLRGPARRRVALAMAATSAARVSSDEADGEGATSSEAVPVGGSGRVLARRIIRRLLRPVSRWRRLLRFFPLDPLGWAAALESIAEPADIVHGMWAGSLPALSRLRRQWGARAIYDSRDVYLQSRDFATLGRPLRPMIERLERRWAQRVDRVITVNDAYAALLATQLRVATPIVIMNCPARWTPPEPPPDLIRQRLGLSPDTTIVLYQGGLMTARGIEQSMDAILAVPGSALCLLGFGRLTWSLRQRVAEPPYAGHVWLLDAVPPDELLAWTASADVSVMAIQPTSINHTYTTPQKLFESIAAGVPVVASDLPGMAEIVRAHGIGVTCDPTSPAAIAAAIRELVSAPPETRAALRRHVLAVAHDRYNWEDQVGTLLGLYAELRPAT